MTTQPTEGLIEQLEAIGRQLDHSRSDNFCEDLERLELLHDKLVGAVRALNETMLTFVRASQEQPQP